MPSKKKVDKCPCCNVEINEQFKDHKSSPDHRFHFYIWAYNTKRKALAKDKDGIRLELTPLKAKYPDLKLDYSANRGKYALEIEPSKLQSFDNTLEFRCSLFNDRKDDDMYLTAAQTLDASALSSCYDDKTDWMESRNFIQIKPKERYKGVIIKFHIDNLIVGSFKIPFALNLQTEDGNTDVTLCRTILVTIVDWKDQETDDAKHCSPFTDQPWETDIKIMKPIQKLRLLSNYQIPTEYARCFKYGLKEFKTMSNKDHDILILLKAQMAPGQVTKENYRKFFHNLLWLEECVNILMLRRYNMENVTLQLHGTNELRLEVPGLAEKRPSLIAGDRICIRVHEDHTVTKDILKL
ncbi:hypothetical protein HHI36_017668 [Cryptolaemus montrouzieri]|uniref:Helicase MOV-10-like beta-barrel domain-containing protein n=1 Tax=Cryptolaemus montrouzieri TaxID=559131 RepID=A0ABD2NND1_9CUCU